jgi:hypothetical protein
MFQSFRVELIPRAAGSGYWNMQIVKLKNNTKLLFVCKAHAVQ